VALRPPTAERQPFFRIEPVHPLVIDRLALAPEQDVQVLIARPHPDPGQLTHAPTQWLL